MEIGSIPTLNKPNKTLLIVSKQHGKMVSTFLILLKSMVKERLKDKLVRLWNYLMFQDINMFLVLKYSGVALNKSQPEEDYQENMSLKELRLVWKDLIKNMLMYVSVTDLILRLQFNKHVVHLIGSSVMDTSFIGVLVNGALNKFLKHFMFVKNIPLTNQLLNNHNIIFTADKD